MTFDYNGRVFRSIANSDNGEVSAETIFHYRQTGNIVWATYEGGSIAFGTLIARMSPEGVLTMRYSHVNHSGDLMSGECVSAPEILSDGRYRLHERWQWTSGDHSSGESVLEEVR
jgi:hypothetical protein